MPSHQRAVEQENAAFREIFGLRVQAEAGIQTLRVDLPPESGHGQRVEQTRLEILEDVHPGNLLYHDTEQKGGRIVLHKQAARFVVNIRDIT